MRRLLEGRTATVLAFALGLLIATAGTATAAKLITGKQIKDRSIAERDLAPSVMAKINKAAEAGLRGPAGPAGPAGSVGAKGATGDKGPAGDKGATGDAAAISYTATGSHDFVAPTSLANVLTITLPAGTWVLQGQVVMNTATTATNTGYATQCFLGPMIAPIGLAQARLQGSASFQDSATLPVTDVVDLATESTLTMRCSETPELAPPPGTATGSASGRLVALKVTSNVAQ